MFTAGECPRTGAREEKAIFAPPDRGAHQNAREGRFRGRSALGDIRPGKAKKMQQRPSRRLSDADWR